MSQDQPNDPMEREIQRPLDPIARNDKDLPGRPDGRTKISRVVDVLMSDASAPDAIQPAQVSRRTAMPGAAGGVPVVPEHPWGVASAAQAPAPTELLASVLRFKWTIVLISILVSAPAIALIWTQIVPQYQARAEVRVRPIIPYLVFKTEDNGMIPLYDSFVNTQVSLMRNATVLQRVLDQKTIQETQWYQNAPRTFLERFLAVQTPPM